MRKLESTNLEQLIQQYCPDGVEYRPIWSLTAWDKKFNGIDKSKQKKVIKYNYLLAADLKSYQVEGGTVKLLTTNISNLYTTEELAEGLASDGEVVAIPWGGNPIVQYYKGRFLTADNRIATSLDTTLLSNKFLYYCMLNQMKLIASFYRGSGIKHPEMAKVLDLKIPVPPLPVQEEIVRILDNFTELQAELQAELQKRKLQYEYYRDKLLSFSDLSNRGGQEVSVEWKKLGDVAIIKTGTKPDLIMTTKTDFEYINAGTTNSGYTNLANSDGDAITTPSRGQGGIGFVSYQRNPFWLGPLCYKIVSIQNQLLTKFLYYYLVCHNDVILKLKNTGGVPALNRQDLIGIMIPIPPIKIQQHIISILDRFDALTTDLTAGLPAEIEARRKQYEYYRDKLLTFRECRMQNVECGMWNVECGM